MHDRKRRKKTGVPDSIEFQTKPDIALDQIRRARERGIPQGVVLADAGYGTDTNFRSETDEVWKWFMWWESRAPRRSGNRAKNRNQPRHAKAILDAHENYCNAMPKSQPVPVKELALSLPTEAWKKVTWRQGVKQKLQSRFAAIRVRPAHRRLLALPTSSGRMAAQAMEWPAGESRPTKYWLSTLTADIALLQLVHLAKHRWLIERDYQELKHELGLGHYEGRGWRGASIITPRYASRPIRIPGGRTESFFPLGPYRQSWTSSARAAARLPAAWFAASVPSGIIRAPSGLP